MKIFKNLLPAAILASAIATSTYAGDVGFPPTAPPQPSTICAPVVGPNGDIVASSACVAPEDETTEAYLLALELLVALLLLPNP